MFLLPPHLNKKFGNEKLKFYIGDVRDYQSVLSAVRGADFIFHAAALKQVPSCEFYPLEAIKTNVLGIDNTLNAAINNRVKNIVVLSTDKAVNPINAMGMSKALAEKIAVAKARIKENISTKICVTRYGNVMASRGSVIPLFVKQIKSGGKITITDPDMTRFMMSLDEAVNLVFYGFSNCSQGDLFVQKSPATTIENLVLALKKIFNAKNEVLIMGTRHGEKKHEVLLNREELFKAHDLGEYYKVSIDKKELNFADYFEKGDKPLSSEIEYSSENTKRLNLEMMIEQLLCLEFIQREIGG